MEHAYNSSAWETEAGRLPGVRGQPGLLRPCCINKLVTLDLRGPIVQHPPPCSPLTYTALSLDLSDIWKVNRMSFISVWVTYAAPFFGSGAE